MSFKTLGCRLNQAETYSLALRFESAGYQVVPFGKPCDVCVIHGCTITRTAELKSLRYARSAGASNNPPLVVLVGCVVEAATEDVQSRSGAALVVGQKGKFDLPQRVDDLLAKRLIEGARQNASPVPQEGVPGQEMSQEDRKTRALVKVQDGCDFRCAYCIVPTARGLPVSRAAGEIIDEVHALGESGFKEIVLTGANLGCYANGNTRLIDLLMAVESIPRIERVRLSSIELSTVERQIVDYMVHSVKLCRHLHVPLQTGDDTLLASMGRRYRIPDYRRFVEYALSRIPRLGLGTDVVVGLPGETETAFMNTLQVIGDLPFNNLHVFPYSKRPGTRAAAMSGHIAAAEKKRRVAALLDLAPKRKRAFAETCFGHPVSVLIEQASPDGSGTGWTAEYVEARVTTPPVAPNDVVTFTPRHFDGRFLSA